MYWISSTLKPNPLSIGKVPLNPGRVDREFVESTKSAVEGSKVRKGRVGTARILDGWTGKEPLSEEQFEAVDAYVNAVETKYDKLEDEWWKLHKSKPDSKQKLQVEERMGLEGEVLLHHKKLTTELREANGRAIVKAMAGSLTGVPGLVAAYSSYANGTDWSGPETKNTQAVLKEVHELSAGKSEMVTTGNSVEQVHREKLWKTMHSMLDQSIDKARSGEPTQLDIQLYELTSFEMIKKIAESGKAGTKVRLNLDAGRLSFPSRDKEGLNYFSLDAIPDKIRTIIQLATLPDADIGVSLFPQKKLLNSATDLMHRKVIRNGDQVLVSGMNANLGSGENIDSGYLVEGPAAAKLSKNIIRDIQASRGATLEDIWGESHMEKFAASNLRLGKRGFISMLDSIGGPSDAGTRLPKIESVEQLEAMAKKSGVKFADLIEVNGDYEKEVSRMLGGRYNLQLSPKGKELLKGQVQRAIDLTSTPENMARLDDMTPASTRKVGKTRVDIADLPIEREALVLSAINEAEEFAYLPGFVITRAVAAALVAKRDQMQEDGKDFDVRVVADSGLYPHGGTPNSYGVKYLEDNGIQPRWAKLERSADHDRKIHAKQLITDKGEITGSTNFSTKGLRENWETSALVHFDSENKDSEQDKTQSIYQFETLWNDAFEMNTRDHSALLNRDKDGPGTEWFIEEGRERSVRHVLRLLGNYERESGKMHLALAEQHPDIADQRDRLISGGYSYGDATFRATQRVLGQDKHRTLLDSLGTNDTLNNLKSQVEAFKRGEEVADAEVVAPVDEMEVETEVEMEMELPLELFF
jgi:phosphatidylserine/phosphatidylglycerophosphate/cardiolipin synthase-like enzyme